MATTWFISRDGQQHGPITELEFRKLIELGHLKGTDFVWHDGAPDWMPATQFLERRANEAPPEAAMPEPARSDGASRRSANPRALEATPQRPMRRWLAVIPVAVFVLSGVLAYNFLGPRFYEFFFRPNVDRAAVERQLLADPKMMWLKILQEKQPKSHAEFMDALVERLQKREPMEDSMNYLRKRFVEPIFTANAPHLDDDAMLRYISLIADQMQAFAQSNPALCVRLLRGQDLGNVRPYLPEALQAQELKLLEDALLADKSKPRRWYTQAEQMQVMQGVMIKLAQQHGNLVELINPATPADGRERDACTIGAALFRGIAALPGPNSAALMRSLLSASK
jgi:GYF domain 2